MTFKGGTLLEVAAQASAALELAGIKVAVVGGSAITSYVPEVYTSKDIDFAAVRSKRTIKSSPRPKANV